MVASHLKVASSANQNECSEAAAEEFLAQVDASTGNYEYPLPSPIDSVPADLFGGELGDYELNGEPVIG